MNNTTVIEIGGCKISPEFIDLVSTKLLPMALDAEDFKESLFDVQTAILVGIAGDDVIPTNLQKMACAIQTLNYFMSDLGRLRKEGKF